MIGKTLESVHFIKLSCPIINRVNNHSHDCDFRLDRTLKRIHQQQCTKSLTVVVPIKRKAAKHSRRHMLILDATPQVVR